MARDAAFTLTLCAAEQGFHLHAALRFSAGERWRLEQLCMPDAPPSPARRFKVLGHNKFGGLQRSDESLLSAECTAEHEGPM